MDKLIFYFDRNIGVRLPQTLVALKTPFDVVWHNQQKFRPEMPDDEWMEIAGAKNWVIISQDYKFHREDFENLAVKQHRLKCFYLPDTGATIWKTSCAFIRAHERIMNLCHTEPAPFIYSLKSNGRLVRVKI